MRRTILTLAASAVLALSACEDTSMNYREQRVAGGLAGAAAGYLTAEALDANDEWTILSVLAGAAIGAKVAENRRSGQCAYARGDGTYIVRRC